jgi:hypothetical protein
VVHNEQRALFARQAAERPLDLVRSSNADLRVVGAGPGVEIGDDVKAGLPAPGVANLAVAGVDEKLEEPRFESAFVSQLGQFAPRDQERLLNRILCSATVAQDPVRDRVEPIAQRQDQRCERLLVPSFGPIDEFGVHQDLPAARYQ